MSKFLYYVGKPYPLRSELELLRAQGIKVGLFQDSSVDVKDLTVFDKVVVLDFSTSEAMLAGLSEHDLKVDGLVSTYENYIVAKAQLAEYFNVPALTVESAMACTDKYLMRQAFMQHDPSITPRFELVSSEEELLNAASKMDYPLILKPTNLVKSLLVLKCSTKQELLKNFAYAKETVHELYEKYHIHGRKPQLIIEEFITGRTCSIAAFVDEKGVAHFCDGIVNLTNAQDLGKNDNYIYERCLPSKFDETLSQRLFDTAKKGISALGMRSSPAHVELIYNDKDVKLIEIGARIGGYRPRMYDLSYKLNLLQQESNLALGITPALSANLEAYTAVFELFPDTKGIFDGIEGPSDTAQFTYFRVKAEAGEEIDTAKAGYKATAVIIASSHDKSEFERLRKIAGQYKVTIK